jgi:N-acetylmuramoyl-L-alanine amidase
MKKAVIFAAVLCVFLGSFVQTADAASLQSFKKPSLSMQVMGETLKGADPPIVENGKAYVPLRALGEAMGYKVDYNAKGKTIDLKKAGTHIQISISSKNAYIDGKKIQLENALYLKNGRSYLPISSIYSVFGVSAEYDKGRNIVKVGCLNPSSENQNPQMEKGIYILGKKADIEFLPLIKGKNIMIPLRPIGEGLGYRVAWDIKTQTMTLKKEGHFMAFVINKDKAVVNGKDVKMDEKTIMVQGRAYVPLTFLEKTLEHEFKYNEAINSLVIEEKKTPLVISKVQDIAYDEEGGYPQLNIVADNPVEYKTFTLDNPDRMVIDIMDSIVDTDFEAKEINKGDIIRVRIGQFSSEPSIVRVVVDLKDQKKAKVVQSGDKKSISLVYANIIQPVTIAKEGFSDVITIKGSQPIDSSLFELDNPERFVIDVQRAVLESGEQNISLSNSPIIKSVRTGQFDVGTARVVVDLGKSGFYNIKTEGNVAKVYISDIPFSFMGYDKYYNSSYVSFNLSEEAEYSAKFDKEKNILNIEIKKDIEYDRDLYEINDNLLEYVKLTKGKNSGQVYTKAEFKLKEKVDYELISPELTKLVKFKLVHVPKTPQDILIAIDPGHGGKDPGATALDGSYEKDFNLDVAERLDKKLKGLGFKTIMTRQDDSYITLQERADAANWNYADFFMSIHFNAFMQRTLGIETLYYPNSPTEANNVNNKDIAAIFQQELIKTLNRPSRGIVPRPNLFVLNKTKMPAILTELGFITNKEELSLIKKEEYREAAANALAVSIARYYKEIRNIDLGIDIPAIYTGNAALLQKVEVAAENPSN